MPRENPWIGLGPASPSRVKAKRVSEALQHDFFWACNSEGRYTFLLNLNADGGDWGPGPELRGIAIGYYRGAPIPARSARPVGLGNVLCTLPRSDAGN